MSKLAIADGPSKQDLMLALFFTNELADPKCRFELRVDPVGTYKMKVFIDSVEREDGSGVSFNIEANCSDFKNGRISVYFRTDKREGFAEVHEHVVSQMKEAVLNSY